MTSQNINHSLSSISGKFIAIDGEQYYQISNVDQMKPFFISVVSASDHWLFISSTGCLSAGRIRPENALFPYRSVDYIHENGENTGSKTLVRIDSNTGTKRWEPFNPQHNGIYRLQRNLYKNVAGDKIIFEEINHDLGLTFEYQWASSEDFGFVRASKIKNNNNQMIAIEIVDGIQNILPPNAPLSLMQTSSALLDAYKWNELASGSSLATYSLYAKLSDRAEPAESLLATAVFSVVDHCDSILLSSEQINAFRRGEAIENESLTRGLRGAYFIHKQCELAPNADQCWKIVADIDKTHSDLAKLKQCIDETTDLSALIEDSVEENHRDLLVLMAGSDAYQKTAQEETTVHHYANVLFNNMRGGVVVDQYWVETADFVKTLNQSNIDVKQANVVFLESLPSRIDYQELLALVEQQGDPQLVRLCNEYLPLTFGRRHGDPSRPWNHFEIKLKDEMGERLLSYQGNWRDIFQNWEALGLSYPHFIKSFISKFVNASTIDGYNPYRITKAGIDWELLEADDAWSNIGYWGDHQIIYLLKFLELSKNYQPNDLTALMSSDIFSYANVPYEIAGVDQLFRDPKNTVIFNKAKQAMIEKRVAQIGSDGRLLLDVSNSVYLVNLTEKLLAPLLAKLGNLVVDGGIWLNTQRPEWNDANNAIVGTGLSMVTLYYMRRYVSFFKTLLKDSAPTVSLSSEMAQWVAETTQILLQANQSIGLNNDGDQKLKSEARSCVLRGLAKSAANYRELVYKFGFSNKVEVETKSIIALLEASLRVMDDTIASNLRQDGLYNAYNIINYTEHSVDVDVLYPMLEGQVAILSSGLLSPDEAVTLLDNLYASQMYRADQHTFMLYPDRDLTHFANKNSIDAQRIEANSLLSKMVKSGDRRIIEKDIHGNYHFNAKFENANVLRRALNSVGSDDVNAVTDVLAIYETVFNHQAFTGRSGTMFGYEGLGSIYWHMVSKLLLAVQENYFAAWNVDPMSQATHKLAEYYYKVRAGIGFNKTPDVYGAFPTDPYSHTPKQAGAQQPGMTGQVKEEILTRFGELGLLVKEGRIKFQPTLLKATEFLSHESDFSFIDMNSTPQSIKLSAGNLGFTYCQIPFVYHLTDLEVGQIVVTLSNGETAKIESMELDQALSRAVFARNGVINAIDVTIPKSLLLHA
jgi:hypothetical protein